MSPKPGIPAHQRMAPKPASVPTRGNGKNCVTSDEASADAAASKFLEQARKRASLAAALTPTKLMGPPPVPGTATSTHSPLSLQIFASRVRNYAAL